MSYTFKLLQTPQTKTMNTFVQTIISMLVMSAVYFGIDYKQNDSNSNVYMNKLTANTIDSLPKCLPSDYWLLNIIKNYLYGHDHYYEYDTKLQNYCLVRSSLFINSFEVEHVLIQLTKATSTFNLERIGHTILDASFNQVYKNNSILYKIYKTVQLLVFTFNRMSTMM